MRYTRYILGLSGVLLLFLAVSAANAQLPDGKWTVITHGRVNWVTYAELTAPDGWMMRMANRIAALDVPGHVVIHTMARSNFNLNPPTIESDKHHVLLFDWTETADRMQNMKRDLYLEDGYSYAAGDALYALLSHHSISDDILCLIGYSRGAVVVSETTRRLILRGHDPTQVVFLDGEGFGCEFGYEDSRFDAWDANPGDSIRYDNIYSDWKEILCPLGGHERPRCWNVEVDSIPENAHGVMAEYLINGLAFDGSQFTYPDTLTAPTQAALDPHATTGESDHYPEKLYHGDFEWNSPAGWFNHGGGGAGHIDCLFEPSCHLELDLNDGDRTHSWFWLGEGYTHLKFRFKVSEEDVLFCDDSARIQIIRHNGISFTSTFMYMCDTTDWLTFVRVLPEGYQGQLCKLKIWIDPGGDQDIESELRVDDVTFLECSAAPAAPENASAIPGTICEGELSTLTASAAGSEIDWFANGCGELIVGTGDVIDVNPIESTTYYARARDVATGCVSSSCDTVTVIVNNCSQVPAVSEWGLIVMTPLLLTAGTIVIIRRRRAGRSTSNPSPSLW